ncbi:MAG: Chromosome partition protein Smc [Alphaproteobacteria bacterium MarineAlpha2_Bin1]|nr:MAG: Chromosome partition protein Smc [Alphaproteobacteria bacterium MarineAlpha2_Bin1]
MDFSRIRITGFKSFVDPTELKISQGTTGIVGPNGCGKSNIVEALKWVMGESSAKRIRGSEMDDVIFNGTDRRPSRNLAEVQLFLGNNNGDDEVVVSRRIERELGSRYLINGKDVRARDLQLLFADENIGSQSTALVGQGKIGSIINSKPQERRSILEEAAGIKGLHSRRHEAELRLKAAETNLDRVEDVLETLEAQIKNLKRQSRQANRYRNISGHIRKSEALVLHLKWIEAAERLKNSELSFSSSNNKVNSLTSEAAKKSTAYEKITSSITNSRELAAEAGSKVQRLYVERDKLSDIEERNKIDLERNKQRLLEIKDDISREEKNQLELHATRELLINEKLQLNDFKSQENEKKQKLDQKIFDLNSEKEEAEEKLQVVSQEITSVINDELSNKVSIARSNALKASENRSKAFASRQIARDDLANVESKVTALEAEISTLSEFLNIREDDLWPKLIDSVSVKPGYEKALGAAIGDDLNAATDEGATAYWLNLPEYMSPPTLPKGVEPISNYVQGPEVLNRRLSQIGLVEGIVGNEIITELKQGQRIVNKDGFVWRWDGFISSEKSNISSADRLNQLNKLKKLKSDLLDANIALEEKNNLFSQAEALTNSAHREEEIAQNNVGLIIDEIEKNREIINLYQSELIKGKAGLDNLEQIINYRSDTFNLDEDEKNETSSKNNYKLKSIHKMSDAQEKLKNINELIRNIENNQIQMEQESKSNSIRLNQLETELTNIDKKKIDIDKYLLQLKEKSYSVINEIEELESNPEIISRSRDELMTKIEHAEAKKRETSDHLNEIEKELIQAEKQSKEAQIRLSESREERVKEQSIVELATQNLQSIVQTIREKIDCEPQEALIKSEHDNKKDIPPIEDIELKITRLRNERERMGPVNLRADIETEETLEQLNTLNSEKNDLLGAISRLRRGISDLNKEGRERMTRSFESVNTYFKDFFMTLFDGGKAHLKLVESDDPLEAGLEIMVSPPGKRLQSMSLLSGGEQALAAIALLFAVFKTNPAPICVLDEVDAPLDDSNVHKFCDLIEKIIDNLKTRFLIITHNTITMSRMNRLYGVTMEEKGVSQLVSVDLERASDMKEAV